MTQRLIFGLIAISCMACQPDETISGYADPAAVYTLKTVNDAPFDATATITFPEEGVVRGMGPCNSFQASQTAPYPWFELGPIAATKRACPNLPAETSFFEVLTRMTLSEVNGPVLILSNTNDEALVFQSD